MTPQPVLLALAAGAMLPLQAAINARLARLLGSSVWAAAVSGAVLTAVLVAIGLLAVRALPRTAGVATLPWWAWTGGLCGCFVLTATTAVAPRLGAATMIALVVAGQVLCALAIDHFGLLGLAVHPLTARRLAAGLLLLGGVLLMR